MNRASIRTASRTSVGDHVGIGRPGGALTPEIRMPELIGVPAQVGGYGIKTGYTQDPSFNLVTSVHCDGHYMIGIVVD